MECAVQETSDLTKKLVTGHTEGHSNEWEHSENCSKEMKTVLAGALSREEREP